MDFRGKHPIETFQYIVNTDGNFLYDSSGSLIQNLGLTSSNAKTASSVLTATTLINDVAISSSNIITSEPTSPTQVATKLYVDNFIGFGIDYYFRTASADITDYNKMEKLDVPISSSSSEIITTNVSASQYVFTFISPAIGLQNIKQGEIAVHFHAYRTGGALGNSMFSELYIRSGSVETELIADSPEVLLTTITSDNFTTVMLLTSSIVTNVTDRLVVKFKMANAVATPNVHLTVEGNTAAGITVPTATTNFVLRSGDIMTGNLTVPQVIGTASWATNAINGGTQLYTASTYPITSSWAENAVNGGTQLITGSTYPITSSWAENAVNGGTVLYTGSTYPITSSWAVNAVNGGTVLYTGSTYPITASWAVTSSFARSASWSDTLDGLHGTSYQGILITGSTLPITSSWAVNSVTASALYLPSGSGAWRLSISSSGDLIFTFS